jgi:single-stranded-DNA-specific exonuclease
MGNPEPRFCVTDARIVRADIVGGAHVRCLLASATGGGRLKAMAFRAADTPLGAALLEAGGRSLHFAGTLRPDTWQGRRDAQLFVQDAAYA